MVRSTATDGRLRRGLTAAGAAVLFVSVVVTEPQTTADMAVVTGGFVMVLSGLYLSRRAKRTTMEKVDREKKALEVEPDTVPEDEELPRRDPFDGEG